MQGRDDFLWPLILRDGKRGRVVLLLVACVVYCGSANDTVDEELEDDWDFNLGALVVGDMLCVADI